MLCDNVIAIVTDACMIPKCTADATHSLFSLLYDILYKIVSMTWYF